MVTAILLNYDIDSNAMENLVLPKFGPRTIYCRKILVLGPFLSCKKWSYHAYFGPILGPGGLIVAARNGRRALLLVYLFENGVPILITRSVLELLAFDQTCTNCYTTTPKLDN